MGSSASAQRPLWILLAGTRDRLLKGKNANSQSDSRSLKVFVLAPTHVTVNVPKNFLGEGSHAPMKGRQLTDRKARVERGSLQNDAIASSGDVAFDRPQHAEQRGQAVHPGARAWIDGGASAWDIPAFDSSYALMLRERLRDCNGVLSRQNAFDQSAQRRTSTSQGQRQRITSRVQVLRVCMPVGDHMRQISKVRP
jgi:hypothetical protein